MFQARVGENRHTIPRWSDLRHQPIGARVHPVKPLRSAAHGCSRGSDGLMAWWADPLHHAHYGREPRDCIGISMHLLTELLGLAGLAASCPSYWGGGLPGGVMDRGRGVGGRSFLESLKNM